VNDAARAGNRQVNCGSADLDDSALADGDFVRFSLLRELPGETMTAEQPFRRRTTMPANLVSRDAIPELADQVDSLAMLRVLQHLRKAGYIANGQDVSPVMAAILQRLTSLGLTDAGYDRDRTDRPSMWVGNGNGLRVLRYLEKTADRVEALKPGLEITQRAHTALSSLSEWEQAQVFASVAAFQGKDKSARVGEETAQVGDDRFYLLRVSPELRVFVRILDSDEMELFDIVPEATLQQFLKRVVPGSKKG
jgi:hypothetical protein